LVLEHSPRAVILDSNMSGLDALASIRQVRTGLQTGRPVIITLAHPGQDWLLQALLRAGADYCLLKPVAPALILARPAGQTPEGGHPTRALKRCLTR